MYIYVYTSTEKFSVIICFTMQYTIYGVLKYSLKIQSALVLCVIIENQEFVLISTFRYQFCFFVLQVISLLGSRFKFFIQL